MARTYLNAGGNGINYSRLTIAKSLNNTLYCKIQSGNISSSAVELNQDQIRDLIVQLQSLKITESLIEGNL